MIIDKKGRLFGKINIIDLCVILAVILAAATVYFKFFTSGNESSVETNAALEYVLKASGVREYTVKQFEKGDNLYDDETGKYIGTVTDVSTKTDKGYVLKSDGTYSVAEKPERYDLYITVESTALIDSNGYFAEGIRQISPFSTIVISNKKIKTTTTVDSVGKKQD